MQQGGHHFQAYTIKRDRRQTSTQIFEGIAIPTSCHTNVSLGTNVSLSSRQPSSDHHGLQSLPMETRRIPKFLEASHRHHYFQSRRCFFPFLLLKSGLKSGSLKMRQNHCRMKGAFTVLSSFFFFFFLPGKCETWSVNYYGILSRIEIKFPWKEGTHKIHKQNKTQTTKTHTQAKAPDKGILPGKFAQQSETNETKRAQPLTSSFPP